MRRSASEIIRNLENRVARLESSSNPRQAKDKDAYDIWRRKVDQYIIREMRFTFEYETKDGDHSEDYINSLWQDGVKPSRASKNIILKFEWLKSADMLKHKKYYDAI